MIISTTVLMNWNNKHKKYYENKGYKYTGYGTEFEVKITDLLESSKKEILVSCDYCGNIIQKQYREVVKTSNNTLNNKDCCKSCKNIKEKDIFYQKYGVYNPFQIPQVKEKIFTERLGSNNPNWNNGSSLIRAYINDKLYDWKLKSFQSNNFKCAVSNKKAEIIHHTYSFDLILADVFKNFSLPIQKRIGDYSEEEKLILEREILKRHNVLGIPLTKDIHNSFHRLYGYGNNTPKQWQDFIKNVNLE